MNGSYSIALSQSFNKRLQPVNISVSAGGSSVLNLTYGFDLGSGDNGNVMSIANNNNSLRTQTVAYDSLNRILTAATVAMSGSECWGLTYGIDAWGNWLTGSGLSGYSGCSQGLPTHSVNGNNQLTDAYVRYDAAGDMTVDTGQNGYIYDGESRLTTANPYSGGSYTYTYDGDGRRVEKSGGTLYWRGVGGDVLSETDLSGNNPTDYVYFGGHRLARVTSTGVYYYFQDHLDSARINVEAGQNNACYEADFGPYGDEHPITNTCTPHHKFTGKERDAESGLDNFGARYNASTMGRFMTPDPLLSSGHPSNPQTWNRYAYALNNPLSIIDPTGLYDLVNNCASSDKSCNKQFQQDAKNLKQGLADLQKKVDNMKDGPEKQRLEASLKALGTEGDNNNVNVKFGALPGSAAGDTKTVYDDKTGGLSFNVTFDPSKISGGTNYWGIDAAHEGTHVSDIGDPRYANSATTLSDFSLEHRGHQTSAWAAQALGVSPLAYDGGTNVIWNRGWAAADRQTLMDHGITNHVTSIPGHPETTPHNPWPN